MCCVHPEDMIGWRYGEPITSREERRVYVVDQLSCICHPDFLSIVIENVQRNAGNECIAEGRKIGPKVAGIDAGIGFIPCSPFIDDKLELVLRVDLSHQLPV